MPVGIVSRVQTWQAERQEAVPPPRGFGAAVSYSAGKF